MAVLTVTTMLVPASAEAATILAGDDSIDAPEFCDGDRLPFNHKGAINFTEEFHLRVTMPAGARIQVHGNVTIDSGFYSGATLTLQAHDHTLGDTEDSPWRNVYAPGTRASTSYSEFSSTTGYPSGATFSEPHEVSLRWTVLGNDTRGSVYLDLEGVTGLQTVGCRVGQLLGLYAEYLGLVGDPANTFSGNTALERTDIAARPGTMGPESTRFYNSQDTRNGILGRGWRLGYETQVERVYAEDPDTPESLAPPERSDVVFQDPSGRVAVFNYSTTTDDWIDPPDMVAELSFVSGHYQLLWRETGETWAFTANDPPEGEPDRLASITYPSGEVVSLTWGTPEMSSVLLEASSSAGPTVYRWSDLDSPRDGVVDELWVDSTAATEDDLSVNYFYETDGEDDDGDPFLTLHDVTVPHTDDSVGDDPWTTPCEADFPCETYASDDPRVPAAEDFPWITSVTDPTGVEVLHNGYEFPGAHRVTMTSSPAGTWWPEIDNLYDSSASESARSHLVYIDRTSTGISGTFGIAVDGGSSYTAAFDIEPDALEAQLDGIVGGTTVSGVKAVAGTGGNDGWYRIIWGDDQTHSVALTDNISHGVPSGHKDMEHDDEVEWIQPVFDSMLEGSTVLHPGTHDEYFDIHWPTTDAYSLEIETEGVTGGTMTVSTVDDASTRLRRIRHQVFSSGDTVTFDYDLPSDFVYGPSNTEAVWDTEVTFDDGTTTETLTYHHDASGLLVGLTDPNDAAIEKTYNNGQLDSFEDRAGSTFARAFDSQGRLTSQTKPDPGSTGDAVTEYFSYTSTGQPWIHIGYDGKTVTYDYNSSTSRRIPYRVWECGLQDTTGSGSDGVTTDDACPSGGPYTQIDLTTMSTDGVDGLVKTVTAPVDQGTSQVVISYLYDADATETYANCAGQQMCGVAVDGDVTRYEYDAATGQVSLQELPGGEVTVYRYDDAGRLAHQFDDIAWADWEPDSDFDGAHSARSFGYDQAGRLVWMSDESNPDTDGPGGANECGASTPCQPTIEYRYATNGQLEREIQSLDPTQACLTTESPPQPASTADKCTVTVSRHDNAGNLTSVTEADDGDSTFGGSETNADEATTTFTYGVMGRLTKQTDPTGIQTHYCNDIDGNVVRTITGTGSPSCTGSPGSGFEVRATGYDGWGRVVCEVDPTDTVSWESDGSPTCDGEETDTVGETTYSYNDAGQVTEVIEAQGTDVERVVESTYDGLGQLTGTWATRGYVDGADDDTWEGYVEQRTYYPSGRLATVVTPPSDFVSWIWTGADANKGCKEDPDCTSLVSGTPRTTTYTYDASGRVSTVTDPLSVVTRTTYTANGQVDTMERADGTSVEHVTDYTYDNLGRQTYVAIPDPTDGIGVVEQKRTYNPTGLLLTETDFAADADASGTPTRTFTYNHQGWMVTARDPNLASGEAVTYGYDLRGNRTSRLSHRSDADDSSADDYTQAWTYDRADRMLSALVPASETTNYETTYEYDYDGEAPSTLPETGRLWRSTDPTGNTTTNSYVEGLLDEVVYARSGLSTITVGHTYNELGQRTAVTDGTATIGYTYDAAGNQVLADNSATGELQHWFDINGNLRKLEYPDGGKYLFTHDAGRHLTAGAIWTTTWFPISSYTYDAQGRPTLEKTCCGNDNINRHWTYHGDATNGYDGALKDYTQCDKAFFDYCGDGTIYWPTEPPEESILTWRPDGRVATDCRDTTNNGTCSGGDRFVYDTAGQLRGTGPSCPTSGTNPSGCAETWSYDLQGNRLTHDPDTGSGGDIDYAYDKAGHLRGEGDGCAMSGGAPNGSCTTTYTNDDHGRRLTEGTAVTYTLDARGLITHVDIGTSDDIVATYDPNGVLMNVDDGTTNFDAVWDDTMAIPQLVMFDDLRANYGMRRVAVEGGDFFSYDWQDSPINIAAFDQYPTTYDAYGEPDDPGSTIGLIHFGYRSELQIGDTLYLRNRIYDPTTGTFLSPDPLAAEPYGAEEATTTVANAYHYVSNDPLNFTDPLGLCRTTDVTFRIPGDSGASIEPIAGDPQGGWTYEQCSGEEAEGLVSCSSQVREVTGDTLAPTGNALVTCGPDLSDGTNGGKWNWTPESAKDPGNASYCKGTVFNPTRTLPCAEALQMAVWAEGRAARQPTERMENADRHCLWSAIMTWGLGEHGDNGARGFLERHERGQFSYNNDGSLTDSGMDRLNNEVGIRIGRGVGASLRSSANSEVLTDCASAMASGELTY